MALNYVTLVFTAQDAGDDATTGNVEVVPTSVVTAAGLTVVTQEPVVRALGAGTVSISLVANDSTGTTPEAGSWAYNITLPGGTPAPYLVNYSGGATQQFSNLSPAVATTVYGAAVVVTYPLALTLGGTGVDAASDAALLADLGAFPVAGGTLAGWLAPAVVTLTDGATISVNAAAGNDFRVTLGGNRTMAAPTSPVDGQDITFLLTQDGTGSRVVTWNAVYDFGTAGAPTLTTTAGKTDMIAFKYRAAATSWLCLGSSLGF